MDPKTKEEAAGLGAKIITFIVCVMPPVIIANITHWAASIIAEKRISRRARLAIFVGSFGIASFVHWICGLTGFNKYEWIVIASTSMSTPQLLKFFYLEFGEMVKDWVRGYIDNSLRVASKAIRKDERGNDG